MAAMDWSDASTSPTKRLQARQPSADKENHLDRPLDLSVRRSTSVLSDVSNCPQVPSAGPSNPKPKKGGYDIASILEECRKESEEIPQPTPQCPSPPFRPQKKRGHDIESLIKDSPKKWKATPQPTPQCSSPPFHPQKKKGHDIESILKDSPKKTEIPQPTPRCPSPPFRPPPELCYQGSYPHASHWPAQYPGYLNQQPLRNPYVGQLLPNPAPIYPWLLQSQLAFSSRPEPYVVATVAPQSFPHNPSVHPPSSPEGPATAGCPRPAAAANSGAGREEGATAGEEPGPPAASTQGSTEGQRKRRAPQRHIRTSNPSPEEESRLKELMKDYSFIECRTSDNYIKTRPDSDRAFHEERAQRIDALIVQHEDGGKKWSCVSCSKCQGKSRNKVRQHIAASHLPPNYKKYACPCPTLQGRCTHHFEDPFDLLRHELVHTNVKPFSCPNPSGCPNKFVSTQFVTVERHSEKCCPHLNFRGLKKVMGKINFCSLCPSYSVPGHPQKFIAHMLRFHPQTSLVRKCFKDGRRIKLEALTKEGRDALDKLCKDALSTRENVPPERVQDGSGWEHVIALLSGEEGGLSPEDKAWVAAAKERAAEKGIVLLAPRASPEEQSTSCLNL